MWSFILKIFYFQDNFPYVIRKEKDGAYEMQNSFGKRYIKNIDTYAGVKNMNSSFSSEFSVRREPSFKEDMYEGLLIDILNKLAKDLNINYVLRANAGDYGSLDNISGNWSGIIGQLVERVHIKMTS